MMISIVKTKTDKLQFVPYQHLHFLAGLPS